MKIKTLVFPDLWKSNENRIPPALGLSFLDRAISVTLCAIYDIPCAVLLSLFVKSFLFTYDKLGILI